MRDCGSVVHRNSRSCTMPGSFQECSQQLPLRSLRHSLRRAWFPPNDLHPLWSGLFSACLENETNANSEGVSPKIAYMVVQRVELHDADGKTVA